ncbi:EexN family lipoprotein [Pseudomonas protegens]|uniref:EexN family lipoprotein n=1 Tax=Pseudomonas protegens TaxID=380021 RepID=UPI0023EB40B3|nr:EexN family lipoprotein [Pseudomonas protegens]MDF4211148.1 EexN family lipoprotein [Pseudomonas protegens]
MGLIFMCGFLSACNQEATNDVDFYIENPEKRHAKLVECANNPGEKAIAANCVNAKEAQHKSLFDKKNTGMPSIQ